MNWTTVRKLRILDFDSECRPMHYSEFRDESQITALAWGWVGEQKVWCEVLDQDLDNQRSMLDSFLSFYQEADIVTGHYIRRHDLPLLNDHCMRFRPSDTPAEADPGHERPPVGEGPRSVAGEPVHAVRPQRAEAPHEREEVGGHVVSDVRQHKALRLKLLELGYLKAPRMWSP